MSIHRKLQVLSAIGVVLLAVLAFVAVGRVGTLESALAHVEITSQAMRNHLDSDMMHDALRGDVLEGLMATEPDESQHAIADVATHSKRLRDRVAANAALELGAELKQKIAATGPSLDAYVRSAEEIVKLAVTDGPGAGSRLIAFNKAFEDLEAALEGVSDKIEADITQARKDSEAAVSGSRTLIWVVFGAGLVLLLLVGMALSKQIVAAVLTCEKTAIAFGGGDLTVSANLKTQDETGRLADGLDKALGSLRDSLLGVRQEADSLTGVASELVSISKDLATSSARSSGQATGAADSANSVSAEIATVASGLEQMSAAAREVAANASRAASVAAEAVGLGDAATASMESLKAASISIGTVVRSVADIAEQTNLLALNASIEAARAGESGKGFAVVAGEVKELARQSASATARIGAEIERIQAEVAKAVEAIRAIGGTIHTINQAQAGTAAAAEEQHATLADLSRAVHRVSDGSAEIARAVGLAATSADEGATGASNVAKAAERLNGFAGQVRERLNRFRLS